MSTIYTMDVQFDDPVNIEGFETLPMKNPRSGRTYDLELDLSNVILVK